MATTIPISSVVSVNPSVLAAAGTAVNLNGLILSQSPYVPIGTVMSFANAAAVGAFFGLTAPEYTMAQTYFAGYTGCSATPGLLYFAQYNGSNQVAAYVRGATTGLTLAQLQAISGTLSVTIDGVVKTVSSLNFSLATSFSNAASILSSALSASASWDSVHGAFVVTSGTVGAGAVFTGTIATTTLTVSAVASGTIQVGQVLSGTGVTVGTTVTALVSGTGGTGTYTISPSQTVSSATTISANPSSLSFASGTTATALGLTSAAGATISAGAAATTPSAFMSALVLQTQNWALFTTTYESTLTEKEGFAAWTSSNAPRYGYVPVCSDVLELTIGSTATFGYYLTNTTSSGTIPVWTGNADVTHAAFVLGFAASLNFAQKNGRATLAFRSQAGLTPAQNALSGGTNLTATNAANLKTNGYLFYGAFANATQQFNFFYAGAVSGQWTWVDSYLNQIWLNANLQLSLITLLMNVGSVPYNAQGYSLIHAACMDPINAAINFGAIRVGVNLSASEVAQIQYAVGTDVSSTIYAQGFYLYIQPATSAIRVARTSPAMTLWYADGGSVQSLNLASIEVQ